MEDEMSMSCLIDAAADPCLSALSAHFASRGLVRSVQREAEAQVIAEEKTRASAPCSYRLSLLSEAAVRGSYRCGKETMSGEDLIRYVEESRVLRAEEKDFSDFPSVYESALATPLEPIVTPEKTPSASISQKLSALPQAIGSMKMRLPLWFDFSAEKGSNRKRTFPLSSFAAILAITVSLMLIVTSALMVAGVETEISELNADISQLQAEVKDLESDLESRSDLLEIRRIAIEELGMVEGDYVKTEYISLDTVEKIEAFEREENREITLAGILSAIGWKK